MNKKLSYRRETVRQLHTSFWARSLIVHALHWTSRLLYNYILAKLVSTLLANKPCDIRSLSWIRHSRSFKVILVGDRQKSRTACRPNVQLMPPLFLKRRPTKIWQRENGKFVDCSDPTQVWRRPSKKRLRISTNDLYFQKLELLTYILAADSICRHFLLFMPLSLKFEPSESKSASTKTEFYIATQGPSRSFVLQSVTVRQGVAYRHIILLALSLKFTKN